MTRNKHLQPLRNILLGYKSRKLSIRQLQDELSLFINYLTDEHLAKFLSEREQELEDMTFLVAEREKQNQALKVIQEIETYLAEME